MVPLRSTTPSTLNAFPFVDFISSWSSKNLAAIVASHLPAWVVSTIDHVPLLAAASGPMLDAIKKTDAAMIALVFTIVELFMKNGEWFMA